MQFSPLYSNRTHCFNFEIIQRDNVTNSLLLNQAQLLQHLFLSTLDFIYGVNPAEHAGNYMYHLCNVMKLHSGRMVYFCVSKDSHNNGGSFFKLL